MSNDWTRLSEITDAVYRAEQAKMQVIVGEETAIREKLRTLDAQNKAVVSQSDAALAPIRSLGGDLLWQGWVGRQRAALLTELARVLARKEQAKTGLRKAFGKQAVAQELCEQANAQRLHKLAARRLRDDQDRMGF